MKKTPAERRAVRRAALEKRFAALYVANGRNATAAYRKMFPTCSSASAATKGGQWLRKVGVEAVVAELSAEAWKKEHMTAEEVLARMARLARINIRELYWQPGERDIQGQATTTGQLKSLHDLTEAQAEWIKGFKYSNDGRLIMELWDKPSQLANVAKNLRLLNDKLDIGLSKKLEDIIAESYDVVEKKNASKP